MAHVVHHRGPVLSRMLGHAAGFLLANSELLPSRYTSVYAFIPFELTQLGQCNTYRDVWASNFSLYFSTAVDILCDLLSEPAAPSYCITRMSISEKGFLVMALLLRQLWGLHTNVKQKAALAGIFSLGAIIVIIAIVRVVEIKATIQHVDPVWLALWSAIEASVGMTP